MACRVTRDLPWPITALKHEQTLWLDVDLPAAALPDVVDDALDHGRGVACRDGEPRRHLRPVPSMMLRMEESEEVADGA